ncbi:MAG: sulfotransferase [Thermoleophilia bacterium]|nr:sulfotransferase [Thermoleophilia bacterium]
MAGARGGIVSIARRRSARAFNRGLGRLETALGDGSERPLAQAPVFIVGAPRSGSTLLYQLMVERFDVAYLSNLHCRLHGAPALVERAVRALPAPGSAFTSRYGNTDGARAPSECLQYWYRFFRRSPQHVPLAAADPARLRALRASLRALGRAARRPLVLKNLVSSLRLEPLGATLPEAVFVVATRDPLDNARSILAARRDIHGDYSRWWSVEPPAIAELRALPPEAQAVEQIRHVEDLIRAGCDRLGPERFLRVRYEDLCDDPRGTLETIAALAERNGFSLAPRQEVPERFERGGGRSIDPELDALLVDYLHQPASR